MIYKYCGVRVGRAVVSALLAPGHELTAACLSEVASVALPLTNPSTRLIGTIFATAWAPRFAHHLASKYFERDADFLDAELCTVLLCVAFLLLGE